MNEEIKIRRPCLQCNRTGVVQHPTYAQFFEWDGRRERHTSDDIADQVEVDTWWSDHGYDPRKLPAEEIQCSCCEGSGYVATWEPIALIVEYYRPETLR